MYNDNSGEIWITNDDPLKKLVNGTFVSKYEIPFEELYNGGTIVDENQMLFAGDQGYIYINNKATISKNVEIIDAKSVKNEITPIVTRNNDGSVTVIVDGSKINKDAQNIILSGLGSDVTTVKMKIDIAAIKGGKGTVLLRTGNGEIEFPISVIDLSTAVDGDYVSIKQVIKADDSILGLLKSYKKVFEFDAAIYDKNGNKKNYIQQFKNNEKVKIALNLLAENINGLDTTKLSALYYNEATVKFENLGGTYDSNTKIFSYETTYFSKFVIGEADSIGKVLP